MCSALCSKISRFSPGHLDRGSLDSVPIRITIRSMHGRPQLNQFSAGIYKCTACDFKILTKRPRGLSGKEWKEHLENRLAMHVVESHKAA